MLSMKEKKLLKIIKKKSKIDIIDDSISDNTNLISDLGIDSVKLLDLIVELEESFNVEFQDEELDMEKIIIYKELKELLIKKTE